ncbi:MAG: hypothetical protein IT292_03785 [Deltaproteobacteria bacterium]|nr:hypothetical protein [Deltaproteobacteria bacterium]
MPVLIGLTQLVLDRIETCPEDAQLRAFIRKLFTEDESEEFKDFNVFDTFSFSSLSPDIHEPGTNSALMDNDTFMQDISKALEEETASQCSSSEHNVSYAMVCVTRRCGGGIILMISTFEGALVFIEHFAHSLKGLRIAVYTEEMEVLHFNDSVAEALKEQSCQFMREVRRLVYGIV